MLLCSFHIFFSYVVLTCLLDISIHAYFLCIRDNPCYLSVSCLNRHGHDISHRYHSIGHKLLQESGLNSNSYSFLSVRDEKSYVSEIMSLCRNNVQSCISRKVPLIEVEFPVTRESDIGVGETLDRTIDFTVNLAESFSSFGEKVQTLHLLN